MILSGTISRVALCGGRDHVRMYTSFLSSSPASRWLSILSWIMQWELSSETMLLKSSKPKSILERWTGTGRAMRQVGQRCMSNATSILRSFYLSVSNTKLARHRHTDGYLVSTGKYFLYIHCPNLGPGVLFKNALKLYLHRTSKTGIGFAIVCQEL